MSNCYYQITVDFFKQLFVEFNQIENARIEFFLNLAQDCGSGVSKSLGKVYNQAVLYYAAHNLALSNNRIASANPVTTVNGVGVVETSAQSSPVVSDTVGALSNSYATTQAMSTGTTRENQFLMTNYGVVYLSLVKNATSRISLIQYDNTY